MFIALFRNIIITFSSCVVPMIVGVLAYHFYNRNHPISKFLRICSTVFESICPVVFLVLIYFALNTIKIDRVLFSIIAFSISFIGYMPARYNPDHTAVKNTIVNSLGLVSTIFKWSFCVSMIGVADLLRTGTMKMSISYNPLHLVPVFLISFVVCLLLEFGRYLAREKL